MDYSEEQAAQLSPMFSLSQVAEAVAVVAIQVVVAVQAVIEQDQHFF
jgi:hypothetical protein